MNSTDEGAILRLHDRPPGSDPAGRGTCVLDVGGRWGPGRSDRWRRSQAEDAGEDLRLFYVAATRAQCQLVTWWAPSYNTPASALQRLIYRPTGDEVSLPAAAYDLDGDPFTARDLGTQVRAGDARPSGTRPPGTRRRPTPAALRRPHLRPGAGHRVATHVLLRADRGRPRQRAGGGRRGQRARAGPRRTTRSALQVELDGLVPAPPPRRRPGRCRRRWRTCRPARSSGSRCTRCWRRSTRQAGDLAAELRRAGQAVLARLPAGSFTADQLADGPAAGLRHAARPAGRGPHAGRHPAPRPARRAGLRAAAGRRRGHAGPTCGWATWSRCSAEHLPPTDPLAGVPRRPGRPHAGRPDPARLPDRQHRRRAAGLRSRRRRRAIWSSTTRPTGSARWTGDR